MSETESNLSSSNTPPGKRLSTTGVTILGIYHVVLAILLVYALYQVWPPSPWPGDKPKAQAQAAPPPNPSPAPTGQPSPAASASPSAAATPSASPRAVASPTPTPTASPTPSPGAGDKAQEVLPPKFTLFMQDFQPPLDTRLILIVILAGALGSYIHVASSLTDFVGNQRLYSSWVLWYLLRPFIGVSMALLFYFVFRGGFITPAPSNAVNGADGASAATFINPFGIAALAGLVGMFSKTASDKLKEVFETLFRSDADAKRGGKLGNPVPSLKTLVPQTGKKGEAASITLTGSDFAEKAQVLIKGAARAAQFVSATELKVQLTAQDTATTGSLEIKVVNSPPNGGTSGSLIFTVTD